MLNDGKKDIELKKDDILYVARFVRFTFTERFLMSLAVKNGNFLTRKRYLFFNDLQNNLIDTFKNMKVDLKNFP